MNIKFTYPIQTLHELCSVPSHSHRSSLRRNDAYIWEDGNICRRTTPADEDSSSADIKAAFDKCSSDDGKLDLQGFIGAAVICGEGFKTLEEAKTAFNSVDKSSAGTISLEGFIEFLDTV